MRLADVVAHCMAVEKLPLRRAAEKVLQELEDDSTVDLYELVPGDWGKPVSEEAVFSEDVDLETGIPFPTVSFWEEQPPPIPPESRGRAGALTWLRSVWTKQARNPQDLDFSRGGPVAVLATKAAQLFDYGTADGTESGLSIWLAPRWPHAKGVKWTDAEKGAMRAMREQGQSDEEIAKAVGCSRQVVGQQIGSKVASKAAKQTQNKLSVVG